MSPRQGTMLYDYGRHIFTPS